MQTQLGESDALGGLPGLSMEGSGAGEAAVLSAGRGLCDERLDTRIGRYRLVRAIGEGGFGVVYLAEQEEPIRRQVALKVIKLGMDTKAVVSRFEGERQALAMMEHPNIAKVFDAGATITGRPYFVMELVKGLPINAFCDERRLSTAERLELYLAVCAAVQHAHQRGVIHRDLKPSNLLVAEQDGKASPKVIDFGIAKATQGRLAEEMPVTELRHFIGTPAYMSPEQFHLEGLDIDTRSDLYSLGVILYELMTGATPFDEVRLRSAGGEEMRRTMREEDPPVPSTRLATLAGEALAAAAERRRSEPSKLIKSVKGDLDAIIMKCLEKDRRLRYDSAGALARDVERFLANEAVHARKAGAGYRIGKLVRKHRGAVAAVAGAVVLLAGTAVVSTWFAIRAIAERNRADELIANAAGRPPESVLVGQYEKLKGQNNIETLAALTHLVDFYDTKPSRKAEAVHYLREELALRRRLFGEHDQSVAQTMNTIAGDIRTSNMREAADLSRGALDILEHMPSPSGYRIAVAKIFLAEELISLKEYEEAERLTIEGYEGLVSLPPASEGGSADIYVEEVNRAVATGQRLYTVWQKPEKLAAWTAGHQKVVSGATKQGELKP